MVNLTNNIFLKIVIFPDGSHTDLKVTGEMRPMRAYAVTLCKWNRAPSNSSSNTTSWDNLKFLSPFPITGISYSTKTSSDTNAVYVVVNTQQLIV